MWSKNRFVLRLQKFEGADQQRNIVTIDRSVITQTELLEDHTRHEQVFHAFFDLVREVQRGLASDRLNEFARLFVQILEGRVRDDVVQVGGNRADVFRDRPLVVVEHDDEALRLRLDVVERLVADAAGEARRRPPPPRRASFVPRKSRPTAMPSAAESAVPA